MKFLFNRKKANEEKAADWVLKQDEGLSAREELEYEAWKHEDSAAKELAEKYQAALDKFDALKVHDVERLTEPDPGLFAPDSEPSKWPRYGWGVAVSIAIIVASLFGKTYRLIPGFEEPQVAVETFHSRVSDYHEMSDGSTLELNADTEVDYRYTKASREFWVKSGEAYFTVTKDPRRPFTVYVYDSRIQALGTQFNVRYQEDSVEVLVTEGTIAVSSRDAMDLKPDNDVITRRVNTISVNQRTTIYPHHEEPLEAVDRVTSEELDKILAWKPVTLRFSETPLHMVVEAFNAHNSTQIIISDESLNDLYIDVAFRSNKIQGFVRLIEATHNVVANRQGERIYLYRRN